MSNYRLTPLRDMTEQKNRVIAHVKNEMEGKQVVVTKQKCWKPILVSVALVMIALFLTAPYINNALFNKDPFMIEKVVIPNVDYGSLIDSTYIDETNEFIYNTENGFYSYSVESKSQSLLVSTEDVGRRIYDYAVSEKWLVWAQPVNDEEKIHVLNRETGEQKVLPNDFFAMLQIHGEQIFYIGFEEKTATYVSYDLNTGKQEIVFELVGNSQSKPSFDERHILGSRSYKINNQKQTTMTIKNINTLETIGVYSVPYDIAQYIQLEGNKVYALFGKTNSNQPYILGGIDRDTNQLIEIEYKTSISAQDFATDGEHFAISVNQGESSDVQLFELEENELKRTSKISDIKERLVKPRFTEDGTLVLNGEGKDLAMYLIRFE